MSSDPRSLAHEVGIGTGLGSHATGGRLENTLFYLPLEADLRTFCSTCHWRQTGEHSVLPATGGRLEKTPLYLPLEADWGTLRSNCNQQKKRQQYLHI